MTATLSSLASFCHNGRHVSMSPPDLGGPFFVDSPSVAICHTAYLHAQREEFLEELESSKSKASAARRLSWRLLARLAVREMRFSRGGDSNAVRQGSSEDVAASSLEKILARDDRARRTVPKVIRVEEANTTSDSPTINSFNHKSQPTDESTPARDTIVTLENEITDLKAKLARGEETSTVREKALQNQITALKAELILEEAISAGREKARADLSASQERRRAEVAMLRAKTSALGATIRERDQQIERAQAEGATEADGLRQAAASLRARLARRQDEARALADEAAGLRARAAARRREAADLAGGAGEERARAAGAGRHPAGDGRGGRVAAAAARAGGRVAAADAARRERRVPGPGAAPVAIVVPPRRASAPLARPRAGAGSGARAQRRAGARASAPRRRPRRHRPRPSRPRPRMPTRRCSGRSRSATRRSRASTRSSASCSTAPARRTSGPRGWRRGWRAGTRGPRGPNPTAVPSAGTGARGRGERHEEEPGSGRSRVGSGSRAGDGGADSIWIGCRCGAEEKHGLATPPPESPVLRAAVPRRAASVRVPGSRAEGERPRVASSWSNRSFCGGTVRTREIWGAGGLLARLKGRRAVSGP